MATCLNEDCVRFMRWLRFYIPQSLTVGEVLWVEEETRHHMAQVLRLKVGDRLTVFNGDGFDYHGVVQHLDRKTLAIVLERVEPVLRESPLTLTLYACLLKQETMDRVVQKAVELGVKRIVPVKSERVEWRGDEAKKHQHWQGIIRASAMQCGRAVLPELTAIQTVEMVAMAAHDVRWIFSPHHEVAPQQSALQHVQTAAVWVGCEGGFAPQEVDLALKNGWQARSLGARILRADTAAVVALTQAQMHYGDLASAIFKT